MEQLLFPGNEMKILLSSVVRSVLASLLLAAPASAASIAIAWDRNPEPDVTGYVVLYGTASGRFDSIVDVGGGTTWTLADAVAGRTYYFRVQAYNADGLKSELSSEVTYAVDGGSRPVMAIDAPARNSSVQEDFVIAGWAADLGAASSAGVDVIHVWAYPNPGSGSPPVFLGQAAYGSPRPDVAAAFNAPQAAASGYGLRVSALAPGVYDVVVYARSTVAGTFNNAQVVRVTVQARTSRPRMAVDIPSSNAAVTGSFTVAGWALDLAAPAGSGVDAVHVWAYPLNGAPPVFVGAAAVGGSRPDVGAAFGGQFAGAGYNLRGQLAAGSYNLVVFARSSITRTFNLSTVVPIRVK
jgi:hypothetical protein